MVTVSCEPACCPDYMLPAAAGDYTPTYWLTQTMLIALLALTFTVLPYLTGQLMTALSSTSSYQRKRYVGPLEALAAVIKMPAVTGLMTYVHREAWGLFKAWICQLPLSSWFVWQGQELCILAGHPKGVERRCSMLAALHTMLRRAAILATV